MTFVLKRRATPVPDFDYFYSRVDKGALTVYQQKSITADTKFTSNSAWLKTLDYPPNTWIVLFNPDGPFWINYTLEATFESKKALKGYLKLRYNAELPP
jgi:hypothetical protein